MKKDLEVLKNYLMYNELPIGEKKFVVNYMAHLMENGNENPKEVNLVNILTDIKILNERLKDSNDTSLVKDRIEREIDLLSEVSSFCMNCTEEQLVSVSYKLDKLYFDSELPFRNTDTVVRMAKLVRDNKTMDRGKR